LIWCRIDDGAWIDIQGKRTLMKNVQYIDDADNCPYDIYALTDEEFTMVFPDGQDIEFIEDLTKRIPDEFAGILQRFWRRPVDKKTVNGIHGTLFFKWETKKDYYPTKKDNEMVNPFNGRILDKSQR
jgi:hypothetical protein